MPGNLQKRKLLVISDTAVYEENGITYGFEPVVRELEVLTSMFDEIVWLGCNIDKKDRAFAIPGSKIRIVIMPSVWKAGFFSKMQMLFNYPVFLFYILKYFFSSTDIHTRAPSHPALIGIIISFFTSKKKIWHKYAGNWIEKNPPFMYKLQRSLLKKLTKLNITITVNGNWPEQNKQIRAFENPCIYSDELDSALTTVEHKNFNSALSLLFVGNLSRAKGVLELMEAAAANLIPPQFKYLYIIGNGPLYQELNERAAAIKSIEVVMTGHLNRKKINEFYKKSHCFILPSFSEGFPKVVAEAASYGCIPVVTDISALSQYIKNGYNGYLMKNNSPEIIGATLHTFVSNNNYRQMSLNVSRISHRFTYEYFKERMKGEIFN